MIPKYCVEYTVRSGRAGRALHYSTDDPVACEEFLVDLLERSRKIRAIKHDGVDMPRPEFDRLVRTAGGMLAARRVCAALDIKPEEEHFRFGFVS